MKHFNKNLSKSFLLLLTMIVFSMIPLQSTTTLKKIVLAVHWQPQAQFAGYYAAITKGIYKKYGLDVTIRHTGFKDNAIDYLKNGGAQFITHFLSGAMEEYGKGVDLKLIAQVSHKSALTIAGIKSRGIKQVSNLNNKKIAIWQAGFRELPQAFLKKYNINAEFVPVRSTVNLFLLGGVDAQVVMDYNELNSIIFSGIDEDDLTLFKIADYGLNVPEDGIYCSSDFLEKNKDLCAKFVRASMEGWLAAFEEKSESVDYCLRLKRKSGQSANYAHQLRMLNTMEEIIAPKDGKIDPKLNKASFDIAVQIMKESGRLKKDILYDDFYKTVVK